MNVCSSAEDIENCKKRDMLEQLLAELAGEYPAFGEVLLNERDIFLTHSLQAAATSQLTPNGELIKQRLKLKIIEQLVKQLNMLGEWVSALKVHMIFAFFFVNNRNFSEHLGVESGPLRVVGVVGMGHAAGIMKLWPHDQHPYLKDILSLPPPSLTSRVIKVTFRISLLTFGGYLVYRFAPLPRVFRETCESALGKLLTNLREVRVAAVKM